MDSKPNRSAPGIVDHSVKRESRRGRAAILMIGKFLLCFLALCLVFKAGSAMAQVSVPLKSIAQLRLDDDSKALAYAGYVFYDPVENEIYVSNTARGRVVVYGPDFFPYMSIGRSRGVMSPRGGTVMPNGDVYICQERNWDNPRARITILNGAFFVDREIFLDEIPEAAGFVPEHVAVSADGTIYLAGADSRGVLVLDSDGSYLRKLEPKDEISSILKPVDQVKEKEKQPTKEDKMLADIPEEFRPKKSESEGGNPFQRGIGPVQVNNVTIDSTGKIYLLSIETGKVYVYGPDEKFLFSFGEKGGTPRHLSNPKAVAIDEKRGLIYVVDYLRQCILTYDMAGKYLFEFGGLGRAPCWFSYPNDMALNKKGQVIVADLMNRRIQVLDVGYDQLVAKTNKDSSANSSSADSDAVGSSNQGEDASTQPADSGAKEVSTENDSSKASEEVAGSSNQGEDASTQPADSGAMVVSTENDSSKASEEAAGSSNQGEDASTQPADSGAKEVSTETDSSKASGEAAGSGTGKAVEAPSPVQTGATGKIQEEKLDN